MEKLIEEVSEGAKEMKIILGDLNEATKDVKNFETKGALENFRVESRRVLFIMERSIIQARDNTDISLLGKYSKRMKEIRKELPKFKEGLLEVIGVVEAI